MTEPMISNVVLLRSTNTVQALENIKAAEHLVDALLNTLATTFAATSEAFEIIDEMEKSLEKFNASDQFTREGLVTPRLFECDCAPEGLRALVKRGRVLTEAAIVQRAAVQRGEKK